MSAFTANSQTLFELPRLSYIDARWEEPNLRTTEGNRKPARTSGWLARQMGTLVTWYSNREAASELAAMSDYELADIGLTRSDLPRVFKPDFEQDFVRNAYGS
jgi:uncharacterized protein YjiS (DUF1127 family)